MTEQREPIAVKIYNDTYSLRTSAPQEKVLQVAAEVNKRMQQLAANKSVITMEKLAVWTALDLAADFQEMQERNQQLAEELKALEARYDRLVQAIRER